MKTIVNVSRQDREVPALGVIVPAGGEVEVEDDALAASLLEQPDVWAHVSTSAAKKAENAAKRAARKEDDQ